MLDKELLIELQEYVESHLSSLIFNVCEAPRYSARNICEEMQSIELEDFIKNKRKPTFKQVLFNFIDKKGVTDLDIYKRAGIDRRHFSKIRS